MELIDEIKEVYKLINETKFKERTYIAKRYTVQDITNLLEKIILKYETNNK